MLIYFHGDMLDATLGMLVFICTMHACQFNMLS